MKLSSLSSYAKSVTYIANQIITKIVINTIPMLPILRYSSNIVTKTDATITRNKNPIAIKNEIANVIPNPLL